MKNQRKRVKDLIEAMSTKLSALSVGSMVILFKLFSKQKCAMKAEVTISNCTSSNDGVFLAFMASSTVVNLLIATLDVQEVIIENDEN